MDTQALSQQPELPTPLKVPQEIMQAEVAPLGETIQTNQDLSRVIGWKNARLLTWLGRNKSEHYTSFNIAKRRGGFRRIYNPSTVMRLAQYKILTKILNPLNIPEYIHAFEKNKSIPLMAAHHVGKSVILSLDIKDFFDSIHQNQISTLLQSLSIGEKPAKTISEICTYKYFVPQGALTSPKISNLIIANTFGPDLKEFCDTKGLTLTVYADDITVSSNDRIDIKGTIQFIQSILRRHGFKVNEKKTKVMTKKSRHYVCGVVVNEKLNLAREERKLLRAMVHNVSKNGVIVEAEKKGMEPGEFLSHLKGRLGWFKQLNLIQAEILLMKLEDHIDPEIVALEDFVPRF